MLQIPSIDAIGQTPSSPLYTAVAADPIAKVRMNHGDKCSNLYEINMVATAIDPNAVINGCSLRRYLR